LASVVSLLFCFGLYVWQKQIISEQMGFHALSSSIEFLSMTRVSLLLSLGVLTGLMGSYFCVHNLCTGWAAADRVKKK
jgi:hypothetical protein